MLEVKNLKKVYRTKKGAVTPALDDVSLVFPETGMVFILGKSGSGKSTLLNVCGGLDRMDSGEIIIKGKSSKDFSAQDFDSYRNTYVGFVFQEYNILEEFTVEDNIALALELQNKKRDKETIAKILEDVDMTNFAQRKPNTLSGGQKQRVAIARALVKEPEIIMADEPTGALDSKTGQQVFDTLKKLSKDKLVLVVSHDREFAEQYGDRIIELKDGKVLSDMTRSESSDARTVKFYGTDTVCVKAGAELTDADMESIKNFLKKAQGTAVITTSRDQVRYAKETQPELDVGEFKQIEKQPEYKQYGPQKLIRSKFPMRHAIKMGAGSLKAKPVRLVFTILLSIIAFIMFGLASTVMLFNRRDVTEQSLMESSSIPYFALGKAYQVTSTYYNGDKVDSVDVYTRETGYTQKEFEQLAEKFQGAMPKYSVDGISLRNVDMSSNLREFYGELNGLVVGGAAMRIKAGEMPAAADEAAISDFMFDAFKNDKTTFRYGSSAGDKSGKDIPLTNDVNSIIYSETNPVTLVYYGNDGSEKELKIVGVFEAGSVPEEYANFKSSADNNESYGGDYEITYQWRNIREEGLYNLLAVSNEFIEANKSMLSSGNGFNINKYFNNGMSSLQYGYRYSEDDDYLQNASYAYWLAKYGDESLEKLDIYSLDGTKMNSIAADTIVVPAPALARIYQNNMWTLIDADEEYRDLQQQVTGNASQKFMDDNGFPKEEDYTVTDQSSPDYGNVDWEALNRARERWYDQYGTRMSEYANAEWENHPGNKYTKIMNPIQQMSNYNTVEFDEIYAAFKGMDKLIKDYNASLDPDKEQEQGIHLENIILKSDSKNEETTVTLGGFFYTPERDANSLYLSDELYDRFYESYNSSWRNEEETKYVVPDDAYISCVLIPYTSDRAVISELVGMTFTLGDDDSTAVIMNNVVRQLGNAVEMVSMLGTVFLWVGVGLALFAFLLMFNFISASISAKKKEIGILRAIGARSVDVFKIFLSEAFIIALICIAMAIVGTGVLCFVLNRILAANMGVALFVFGPLTIVMILGIALVTSIVSTVIPVAIYSKKPPISSIRAL